MTNPYAGKPIYADANGDMRNTLLLFQRREAKCDERYGSIKRRFGRYYDAFRGISKSTVGAFRNQMHIPFIFSVIQSDVARKVQTSFGPGLIAEFIGNSSDDAASAKKHSQLVSAQLEDSRTFTKAIDFYTTADMYGTAVARVGWRNVVRFEKHRILTEMGTEKIESGWVTRFDGPDHDNIDPVDFDLQPGKLYVQDAKWAFHQYILDFDDVSALAKAGVFDKAGVRQLKLAGMPRAVADEYRERANIYRSESDFEARMSEPFARPVVCKDMVGEVPDDFVPADGCKFRLITVANKSIILRNRPFPGHHGRLPFVAYSPQRDPKAFHGIGKIEPVYKLLLMSDRFANQQADAIDQSIDPVWLVNRLAGIDTENLVVHAGKVIGADGPVDDSTIRAIVPDLRGIPLGSQEIQQLWMWIQQATGAIEDTVMGLPSADRQTKAEFLGRQENVLTRLMCEARLAEKDYVEPLCDFYYEYNKQFLSLPRQLRILGVDAEINPDTGLPLPQEPMTLSLADFGPQYRAKAQGATTMLGKSVKQQNAATLLQLCQSNPVAVQTMNWVAFFKYVFRTFDLPNVNDFFVQQGIPAVNMMAGAGEGQQMGGMMQLMEGGGMPPEALAGLMNGGISG